MPHPQSPPSLQFTFQTMTKWATIRNQASNVFFQYCTNKLLNFRLTPTGSSRALSKFTISRQEDRSSAAFTDLSFWLAARDWNRSRSEVKVRQKLEQGQRSRLCRNRSDSEVKNMTTFYIDKYVISKKRLKQNTCNYRKFKTGITCSNLYFWTHIFYSGLKFYQLFMPQFPCNTKRYKVNHLTKLS